MERGPQKLEQGRAVEGSGRQHRLPLLAHDVKRAGRASAGSGPGPAPPARTAARVSANVPAGPRLRDLVQVPHSQRESLEPTASTSLGAGGPVTGALAPKPAKAP